jgi:hypothetical protein
MLDDAVKGALEKIRTVWDETEDVIKRAERIRAQVVDPAINELRYAGRRLVDAMHLADVASIDPQSRLTFDAYVNDCLFRCYCAQHDALDASILYVQRVIREYEIEFGQPLILKHFPWLTDLKSKLFEADDLIIAARKDRGRRVDIYHTLSNEILPAIVTDHRRLAVSHTALVALFEEFDKGKKTDKSRFQIMLWSTIGAALLGAIVASILTVYLTLKFMPPTTITPDSHTIAPTNGAATTGVDRGFLPPQGTDPKEPL